MRFSTLFFNKYGFNKRGPLWQLIRPLLARHRRRLWLVLAMMPWLPTWYNFGDPQLYASYAPGYGYTAIAVALLARLHPLAVIPAAFLFGALETGSESMERLVGVPAVVSDAVQGVVILAAAIAWRRGARR